MIASNQKLGGQMKRAWMLAAVAVAVASTTAVVFAHQEQATGVTFARSRTAKYSPLVPGVTSYVAWGDTAKGPFGSFVKFRPGFDAGMHTHTADVLLVVLRGAYLYRDDASAKRVGPGDFIRIPGGHKHWSGGDRKEGALFYSETFGKFDLIPVK
jgi:quercetin dioxygenase-like cupin family protein